MKITCQSCQAKYTIADEKVAGKTVKIKCKKCGASIVVSGSEAVAGGPIAAAAATGALTAAPPGDDDEGDGATRVFGDGQPPGGGNEEWTVNVTDDDQRTCTTSQIVFEYQRGVISADTYVWKDGMPDWLPLSGVPELARLVSATSPRPAAAMAAPAAPAVDMPPGGLGGTLIMNEPAASPYAVAPLAAIPSPVAAAAAPAAARRGGKAGGVDLFAAGQHARETTAVAAPPAATTSADRLVGERNENSVLFSISALTASAGASKKNDDPFNLSAPAAPRNGRGNVDDIMNLGGGISGPGMSAPMLAPPPLLAPVVEAPPPPPPRQVAPVAAVPAMNIAMPASSMTADQYPQPKSKTPLILGIVAVVALLGGAGAFFAMRGGAPAAQAPDSTTASPTATATTGNTLAATPPPPTAAPTTPADTPKPADTGTQAATTPVNAAGANAGKAAVTAPAPGKNDSKPDKPAADPKPDKPADAPAKPDKPADAKPADTGGGKEFDRAAAMSALGAASGAARGCKKEDGPTGTARVKVTFAPSGSVTSASVDGPPFAGTGVGACIAGAFRSAHVPAFDGSSVTVSKSISIN